MDKAPAIKEVPHVSPGVMPVLYDAYGAEIQKAQQVPELDPLFLYSPAEIGFGRSSDTSRMVQTQPYKYQSWVYAAVHAIASNLRRLTPYLYNVSDENKQIREHDLLRLWQKPNEYMNGSEFMEAIILNLLLPTTRTPGGQCFLLPGNAELGNFSFFKGNIPDSLFPFSDAYVYADTVAGKLKRWELRLPESTPVYFELDQVVRLKLFNPYNWLQGLSPYSAAMLAVEGDAKATALSNRFADNNANVGGMLSTEKTLTKEQADDLTKRWNAKYAGIDKAGRTAVLYGGLKFEQTSKSLVDMQFIEQKKMNREEILAVYGVPKFVVSLYEDINYATSVAAKKSFWENTLIPYLDVVADGLNSDWIRNIDRRNTHIYFDLSRVSALKDDYTSKIANAKAMIQDGVPLAEAYRLNDIPIEVKMPWMDQALVTGSRTDLDSGEIIGQSSMFGNLADSKDDPKDDTTDGEDPKAPKGEEDTAKPKKDPKEEDKNVNTILRIENIRITKDEREKFWFKYVEKTLNPPEKRFITMMKRYFIDQRNLMQDMVDEWASKSPELKSIGLNRAFSIADLIPEKTLENKKLKEKASPLYDVIVELQAAKMQDEIGEFVNWTEQGAYIEKFKKLRYKQLQKINTHTFEVAREEINKVVGDGITANLTVDEIAKNIKSIEKDIYDVRIDNAIRIARTETASIASSTRFSIMDIEGIELHEWISAKDEAVRHTHEEEDGHTVEVGESFPSTGLIYPCYPGGAPEEVINCRCVTVAKKSK